MSDLAGAFSGWDKCPDCKQRMTSLLPLKIIYKEAHYVAKEATWFKKQPVLIPAVRLSEVCTQCKTWRCKCPKCKHEDFVLRPRPEPLQLLAAKSSDLDLTLVIGRTARRGRPFHSVVGWPRTCRSCKAEFLAFDFK
jgi:hypothetical protein